MGNVPFVGLRMSVSEFRNYVSQRPKTPWWATAGVTLHHTGSPTLYTGDSARPKGLIPASLKSLLRFYEKDRGWSSAPHIFVDDVWPRPIVVFQQLNRRGTHAVAFNRSRWGIEVLGNYNVEDPFTGRGRKAWEAGIAAAAILCEQGLGKVPAIGLGRTINYHRHDPTTTKTCPGTRIKDGYLRELLANYTSGAGEFSTSPPIKWRVFDRFENEFPNEFVEFDSQKGRVYVQGEAYANWTGDWQGMLKVRDFKVGPGGKRWIWVRHLGVLAADGANRTLRLKGFKGQA